MSGWLLGLLPVPPPNFLHYPRASTPCRACITLSVAVHAHLAVLAHVDMLAPSFVLAPRFLFAPPSSCYTHPLTQTFFAMLCLTVAFCLSPCQVRPTHPNFLCHDDPNFLCIAVLARLPHPCLAMPDLVPCDVSICLLAMGKWGGGSFIGVLSGDREGV